MTSASGELEDRAKANKIYLAPAGRKAFLRLKAEAKPLLESLMSCLFLTNTVPRKFEGLCPSKIIPPPLL